MLKQQIMNDMKQCMKAKKQTELTGIRMLNAAIKNKEIDLKRELTDVEIISIVKKQIKEHKDSLTHIKDQTSPDAIAYKVYISTLEGYLPEEMPEEEAKAIIGNLLAENNISGKSQMGPAMKLVKPVLEGKIDNSKISKIVKELL